MASITIILFAVFCAIMGYLVGIRRGRETYKNDYDHGWNDAVHYVRQNYAIIPHDKPSKKEKLNVLMEGLDDLFEDPPKDEEIIDGGEY